MNIFRTILSLLRSEPAPLRRTRPVDPAPSPVPSPTIKNPVGLLDLSPRGLGKPGIDGERLRLGWSSIEKSSGVYDWTLIDNAIARKNGVLGISVAMLADAPAHVPGKRYELPPDKQGDIRTIVLPWDLVVQPAILAFIKALCAHVDGKVDYIAMGGLGGVIESYICPDPATLGLTEAVAVAGWTLAVNAITDTHAAALKTTPFVFTTGRPFRTPTSMPALVSTVTALATKYPKRFGVMNCTLSEKSNDGFEPNALIKKFSSTNPCGMQFVTSSRGFGGHDPVDVEGSLVAAISLGARYIELYPLDAEAPENAAMLTKYSALLKSLFPQ